MKEIIQIFLLLFINTSCEEIEYYEYEDIIDEINDIIDSSLTKTQLTIHSVSQQVLKAFNNDMLYSKMSFVDQQDRNVSSDNVELFIKMNTLLECQSWKLVQKQSVLVDIPLNRWLKNLQMNLEVLENEILKINNNIDRLVMNGSRNFTEQCEFSNTEDELYDCLQSAVDDVNLVCDTLLEKLSRTLSYFRTIMCLSLYFIHPDDK